ncbi:estradiol 17-beta-dehydrogenase 11-like [Panonychus citri]|uniref:estradiol 17-beta-dehydrogenase 11-like n=1 Tax=Panonychus citri TaxID=50023 RepID=UPI002307DBF0|nr:estradiol 17-beta-dehydrogenase 11-like [Panonychus citri]
MNESLKNLIRLISLVFYHWLEAIVYFFIPGQWRYKSLENETVLITGAASGIGRVLALKLAPKVKCLVLWDINGPPLKATASTIRSLGCKCYEYVGDISNREWVQSMPEKIKSEIGTHVTMIINNAGVVSGKEFLQLSDQEIIRSFDVNILSNFWINRAFLPDMMSTNHGHIVTMATVASFFGVPKLTDYSATKAAVYMLHETLACELMKSGHTGVKCTAICPFLVNTGMFDGASSSLISTLDPEYIAEKIVHAIRTDQFILVLPRIVYYLMVVRSFIPSMSGYYMYKAAGFLELMAKFTGRLSESQKINKNRNSIHQANGSKIIKSS